MGCTLTSVLQMQNSPLGEGAGLSRYPASCANSRLYSGSAGASDDSGRGLGGEVTQTQANKANGGQRVARWRGLQG